MYSTRFQCFKNNSYHGVLFNKYITFGNIFRVYFVNIFSRICLISKNSFSKIFIIENRNLDNIFNVFFCYFNVIKK